MNELSNSTGKPKWRLISVHSTTAPTLGAKGSIFHALVRFWPVPENKDSSGSDTQTWVCNQQACRSAACFVSTQIYGRCCAIVSFEQHRNLCQILFPMTNVLRCFDVGSRIYCIGWCLCV